jgi:CRP/FNR family transcriptional regulator, cyclic AMP receptor protein
MSKAKARPVKASQTRLDFDTQAFLKSAGAARRVATYPKGKVVFSQGQPSDAVMYVQKGGIKISVLSRAGKEAVVAMLGPGDFFGEGALTGQSIRIGTATATMPTTVLFIEKGAMLRLLHDEPTFSDQFISYMLARNLRIEADLVDHLSTPARSGWREPYCCWRGTAIKLVRSGRSRRSPKKRSLK